MADFTDVDPDHPPHDLAAVLKWALLDRLTGRRRREPPGPPAPRVEPRRERLLGAARNQLLWLGHASFLVQLDGRSVLIDPVLGNRLGLVYRRYQAAALEPARLPPIDVLLITHAHRDHLDEWTLRRLDHSLQVAVPEGLGAFFRARGFSDVVELGWWQTTRRADLEVTLVPARHWTRRGVNDLNASLWGGFVVATGGSGRQHRAAVLHAGDSAYWQGFRQVGERFPDLDVALLPIGAYAPGWFMEHCHMTPEQAGRAFIDLGARAMVPMHWGTFRLTDEPLREPAERLRAWWRHHRPSGRLHELPVGGLLEIRRGQ